MLFKTYHAARTYCHENAPFASWKTLTIERVKMGPMELFRVVEFNEYGDKCKRCHKATRKTQRKACSGATCPRCGNPFYGMTRKYRTNRSGTWQTTDAWRSAGVIH